MYFWIEDDDLLEKYNTVWDSDPVYNKEYLQSHGDDVTDFYDKERPKVDSNHTCLAGNSYYSKVLLKECKYLEKKCS